MYVSSDYHEVIRPIAAQASYCEEICSTFITAGKLQIPHEEQYSAVLTMLHLFFIFIDLMDYSSFLSISTGKLRKQFCHSLISDGDVDIQLWHSGITMEWTISGSICKLEPDKQVQ